MEESARIGTKKPRLRFSGFTVEENQARFKLLRGTCMPAVYPEAIWIPFSLSYCGSRWSDNIRICLGVRYRSFLL